ncbi:hypothetical protein CU669_04895 [Paramagnetospirillum kuznetsovii]|uniref:Uncharacterized protein n=1 Tax=Paramagnetospirillum kuznetsovii TaxID=2053833 RepID=A0A364P2B6_9PROT|nr:hypothetical protein [Paramagnetospirillum kuznetsovii]RAU23461.1 hypothetical protein CU669_04895 [Paramagnetospirillum kuznetsovii]
MLAGTKAAAMAPMAAKTISVGIGVTVGWGLLSILAVAAVGSVYFARKYAGPLDVPVTDLEA